MLSLNEPIKMKNSCSYKLIFEKLGERNRKRISQFSKRKTALSTNQKEKGKNKNISKIIKNEDKMNEKDVINIFNLIINGNNNEIKIEKRIIENIDNININVLTDTGIPKKINSRQNNNNNNNNHINNNKNNVLINQKRIIKKYNNNISNNNTSNNNNNNINNEINKEVNISNLEEEKDNISNNIHKLSENNEYALNFLSSSNDSFVPLGNNLIIKAKIQKNYFTESYSQALECDYDNSNNKIFDIKKLNDIEIIKEEKEADTPLKRRKNIINKMDDSNKLFAMRKKIKLLKEKRKSKSLTKELYALNKKDKKIIDEIIISIPNSSKNNNNYEKSNEGSIKKAKTKIQLSANNNNNNKIYISLNKNKKPYKKSLNLNNNNNVSKNNDKLACTQKITENKNSMNNDINKNKIFMNTDKHFYNINNRNQKNNTKKNNNINKNNIKQYIANADNNKPKDYYYKGKKMKFICIREKNKYLKNNSLEESPDANNSLNKSKSKKNITLNKQNRIKIKKIISINNSRSIIKNKINQNKKQEKIQSIKLINYNKIKNHYINDIINNNNYVYNRSSPKKNKNKINKSSIQSPFYNNKIIKINKPKIIKYNKINNVNNPNLFQSNKIFKKNISFYENEEKLNLKEEKKPICNSNKKSYINRNIFINQYGLVNNNNNNCRLNKIDISSNYVNFTRVSNNNLKKNKFLNTSVNNMNFDKMKSNNSYYLYVDINSL